MYLYETPLFRIESNREKFRGDFIKHILFAYNYLKVHFPKIPTNYTIVFIDEDKKDRKYSGVTQFNNMGCESKVYIDYLKYNLHDNIMRELSLKKAPLVNQMMRKIALMLMSLRYYLNIYLIMRNIYG